MWFKRVQIKYKLNCVSTWGKDVLVLHLGVCFQRHKEYLKMLKERTEALGELKARLILLIVTLENMSSMLFSLTWSRLSEEAEGDLDELITGTTESVQYDHPNHTVTVTTISDLDLTGAHLLGPAANQVNSRASVRPNSLHVCFWSGEMMLVFLLVALWVLRMILMVIKLH